MISKSLFTNNVTSGSTRLIYNPIDLFSSSSGKTRNIVEEVIKIVTQTIIQYVDRIEYLDRVIYQDRVEYIDRIEYLDRVIYQDRVEYIDRITFVDRVVNSADLQLIKDSYLELLRKIETDYGDPASSQNYVVINRSHTAYVNLYDQVTDLQNIITDEALSLFVTLAKETLITAFHAVNLHIDNVTLLVEKSMLQQKVNQILAEANKEIVEDTTSSGQFTITQSVQLAPVYNYYITVYGAPCYGVGFNPLKVSFLAEILTTLGISPYN
jgi:hypothetical protein